MFKNFNSQNFNSQHLLIGIFIVFIIFIFLSRENFYSWNPIANEIRIPTPPNIFIPNQLPANKTCPRNSTLINDDFCEYSQSIQRPSIFGIPRQCPDNYEPSSRTRCRAINPRTSPKLTCNDNSVPVEGKCQECPSGAKLFGRMCYSCDNNKSLDNLMCY
jgi:hypothetical protein